MSAEVVQLEAKAEPQAHNLTPGADAGPHAHRDNGLLAIGLFKLGKAIFFFSIGLGVVHLIDKNLGDEVMRLAMALRRDPEGRFVQLALEKVDTIDAHRLKEIGFGSIAYSGLALTEGIGLMLQKVWAEYLTLILTISFLPWELYEVFRGPTPIRLGLLFTNLIVLAYIVWLLQRKKQSRAT